MFVVNKEGNIRSHSKLKERDMECMDHLHCRFATYYILCGVLLTARSILKSTFTFSIIYRNVELHNFYFRN
jgi:hypothetical protein